MPNLLILGKSGCGKTTFVERFLAGRFLEDSPAHSKIRRIVLDVPTNLGYRRLQIFEANTFPENLPISGMICMFNLMETLDLNEIQQQIDFGISKYGKIPVVLVGTHLDQVSEGDSTLLDQIQPLLQKFAFRDVLLTYYSISSKTSFNLEKPLIDILRRWEQPDISSVQELATSPLSVC